MGNANPSYVGKKFSDGTEITGLDTDATMAGNSATKVPSQSAVVSYVQNAVQGQSPKDAVRLATTAALPSNTYLSNVLTGVAFGALSVDGSTVAVNDRLLVKDEATQANNGLYVVTATGGAAAVYVLTRTSDMNAGAEVPGAIVNVEAGTVNVGSTWSVNGAGPYTLGTTAIVWSAGLVAGTGLTKTGNTLSVAYGTTAGTSTQGNDVRLAVVPWIASTAYATGQLALNPSGTLIVRIAAGTSRASYDATEIALWTTDGAGAYVPQLSGTIDTATSGALVANTVALISASGGNVSRALPTTAAAGAQIIVGKSDNSTNTVTATGTINGVGAQSVVLRAQGETVELFSDGAAGWLVGPGAATAWADGRYQLAGSAVGSQLDSAVMTSNVTGLVLTNNTWVDITGSPLAIAPVLGARTVEVEAVLAIQFAAAADVQLGIYDATAAAIVGSEPFNSVAGTHNYSPRVKVSVNPGAGARGYRPQLRSTGSSPTVTVFSTATLSSISQISCAQR